MAEVVQRTAAAQGRGGKHGVDAGVGQNFYGGIRHFGVKVFAEGVDPEDDLGFAGGQALALA